MLVFFFVIFRATAGDDPELEVQLDVFEQFKQQDFESLSIPKDLDLNDHQEIFLLVLQRVSSEGD